MFNRARTNFAALVVGACAATSFAQVPASGMWGFDGELNGNPGRGIQIDTQGGNLLIATYFGYREDGSATFYQASGPVTDGVFVGELREFAGGPTLIGTPNSGAVFNSLGPVKLRFSSSTAGVIELPAGQVKNISRFQFMDNSSRFNNFFWATRTNTADTRIAEQFPIEFSVRDNAFIMKHHQCTFLGRYALDDAGISSSGDYSCADGRFGNYSTFGFSVSADGTLGGYLSTSGGNEPPTRYQYFGKCVIGWNGSDGIPCDKF